MRNKSLYITREKKSEPGLLSSMSYILIIIVSVISFVGFLAIGNSVGTQLEETATLAERLKAIFSQEYVRLQVIWFLTGLGIMLAMTLTVSYKTVGKIYLVLYFINIVILLLLLAFASSTRGAVSWFEVGESRAFQPSEFCKLAIIICLAKVLSKNNSIKGIKQLLLPLLLFAVPFVLIILQPDLGTALVYIAIFVIMLFVGGISIKLIVLGVGLGALAIPLAIKYVLSDSQRMRLNGFFGRSNAAATSDSTYQLDNSLMVIRNGGLKGKGLLSGGSFSQFGYVPDQHTDFVFSSACEAFGLVGAILIIGLYFLLLAVLIIMAIRTPDRFGRLMITGVTAMLFFHIFENIGMTYGVMPITGIPLPFMSYGGSSMWTNMLALGLCENAYARRKRDPESRPISMR